MAEYTKNYWPYVAAQFNDPTNLAREKGNALNHMKGNALRSPDGQDVSGVTVTVLSTSTHHGWVEAVIQFSATLP